MTDRRELTIDTRYRLFLEIVHRVCGTLELDEILDHVLDALHAAVGYDAAGIYVRCEDLIPSRQQRPRALIAGVARRGYDHRRDPDDPMLNRALGVVGDVIRTGEPAVIADVRDDARYVVGRESTLAEIAVPIVLNGRTIGALNLESDAVGAFTAEDLEILCFFADTTAVVIQRAILHRQLLDQRRLEDQLRLAHEVQASLLPAGAPELPGYAMAGRCIPTFEIGGDCFDYIRLPDGRLGLLVADVSGKGIPAALVMTSFRSLLRAQARFDPDPATLAAAVNRQLPDHIATAAFVTAFYGVLDPATGDMAYVNCGHNPPLLIRADGGREELVTGGPPLGAFEDAGYDAAATRLEPGDTLVIYTDGVVENDDDEFGDFGAPRLAELLVKRRRRRPREIVDAVVAETRQFHGISTYPDDFTLLVIQRLRD